MESAATQSILSRRPAAGGLPQFHLPPPNTSLDLQIPRVSDSISPPSSSLNSSSSHSPHTSVTQYSNANGWPMANNSSYTYGSIAPGSQSNIMSSNYNRHIFSSSAPSAPGGSGQQGYGGRSSQSPATADALPPPYDNVNHSFLPMSISGGATNHSSFASQPSHPQHLQHAILGSQTSQPPTPATSAPPDAYSRAPPTPGYYTASSSTPQQTSFPAFPPPHHSPTPLSPTTTGTPTRAIPALSSQHHAPMGALPAYGNRHYNYSTSVHGLGPVVLSNMGNPGGQMHLMGATNPLNAYHTGHALGHHSIYPGAPHSQQDRPYRCDTCPQSFNRNHDLKRHKRIHLAVKPYPCEYCDKAFSRKDALKRHRLVKGCGNNGKTSPNSGSGGSPREDPKMHIDGPTSSSGAVKDEST
ncbi:hypothetical protein F4861DRAFT_265908 [Xylaria intraflava]|nr:hypothetical protein F4861DRAFT_265908 [Xylaria intraflava]